MIEFKLFQFFWLVFAHCIGDFALQHYNMARYKREDPWMFLAHCVVWTGCIVGTLQLFSVFDLWHLPFLFFGHVLIDYFKPKFSNQPKVKNAVDQGLHLIQLIIVWL